MKGGEERGREIKREKGKRAEGRERKDRDRQIDRRQGEKGVELIEGAERSRAGQLSDVCLDSVRGSVAD